MRGTRNRSAGTGIPPEQQPEHGMTHPQNEPLSEERSSSGVPAQAAAALRFTLRLPLRLAGRILRHTVQVIFAIFVVVLHPQVKWLLALIAGSSLVTTYIKPSLQSFAANVYEPYFAFLARLPPWWATFSIAVPLTILEPAKFVATLLIAERPKTGIVLWLALQGVSLILIDRTWTAVRPQSRQIRLVAWLHAWGWLNVQYGKHWIRSSGIYRTAMRWKKQGNRTARRLWSSLRRPRPRNTP
jgi:hypothetical protein